MRGYLSVLALVLAVRPQAQERARIPRRRGERIRRHGHLAQAGGRQPAVDRVVPVGIMPADIDGPHNITVSPDQKNYYITIAHGTPFGSLWKLARDGRLTARPGPGGALSDHDHADARWSVRFGGQLGFPRRPSPGKVGLGRAHADDEQDHRHPRVRHAARGEGEPCRHQDLRVLHAQRRDAGARCRHLQRSRGGPGPARVTPWPRRALRTTGRAAPLVRAGGQGVLADVRLGLARMTHGSTSPATTATVSRSGMRRRSS